MKNTFSLLVLAAAVSFTVSAHGDGNANPLIQNEYAKQQSELEAKVMAEKRTLRDLELRKQKAIEAAKAQSDVDRQGILALKKYWTLVLNRYASADSKFQKWAPVTQADIDNINGLFGTYLASKPLTGRVSAGMADRTLDWGMTRLEEIGKAHASPRPENNSELEILTHQISETDANISRVEDEAGRLGIKLQIREVASEEAAQ